MKKRNEDIPGNLGGLGGMLPAEVLKKLNELLERKHQEDYNNHGSTVINIYKEGSWHIDNVESQYFGEKWAKAFQRKELAEGPPPPELPFDDNTPISALFRENFHDELRSVVESWRPCLVNDDPTIDALAMNRFEFDFSKILAMGVYIDLGSLLCKHPLEDDNMRTLADYLFLHSNLSNSQPTLYAQLRKYMKR